MPRTIHIFRRDAERSLCWNVLVFDEWPRRCPGITRRQSLGADEGSMLCWTCLEQANWTAAYAIETQRKRTA